MPGPSLTRYDAPRPRRGDGARAARRQGPLAAPPSPDGACRGSARAALGRAPRRRLHDEGVGLWLLRYRTVGWNGDGADKVEDARWALDRIRAEVGERPGRPARPLDGRPYGLPRRPTTTRSAASWRWPRGCRRASRSPPSPASELHAAHGRRDRITARRDTRAYVERAREVAGAASFTDMGDRGHYLLRGVRRLERLRRRRAYAACSRPAEPSSAPESSSGLRMKLICFIRRASATVAHGTKPFRFIVR